MAELQRQLDEGASCGCKDEVSNLIHRYNICNVDIKN